MSWHELPTSDIHKMAVEELDTSKLLTNAARQRDERNYKDLLIIDVDCHHYENESLREIVEYIEDPVMKHAAQMATTGGTGVQTFFCRAWSVIRTLRDGSPVIPCERVKKLQPARSIAT